MQQSARPALAAPNGAFATVTPRRGRATAAWAGLFFLVVEVAAAQQSPNAMVHRLGAKPRPPSGIAPLMPVTFKLQRPAPSGRAATNRRSAAMRVTANATQVAGGARFAARPTGGRNEASAQRDPR